MTRRRRVGFVVALFIAAILGTATVVAVTRDEAKPNNGDATTPRAGQRAPGFELATIYGRRIDLASTYGQPTVITFGASWCHPCRREYPLLAAALRQHQSLRVVGIMEQDSPGIMANFMRDLGADWPVANDANGTVRGIYGVDGMPDTWFVQPNGTIASRVIGEIDSSTLNHHLAAILAPVR